MKKEDVRDIFNAGQVVIVTFTKKNGDERVMKCTRNLNLIPEKFHPKGEKKVESDVVLPVFDLEAVGWRSFTFDSVISVTL